MDDLPLCFLLLFSNRPSGHKTYSMKKELFACCVSLFLIGHNFLSAQEQDTVQKLNEVVISATRGERNLYETGRSISVVTADDISKSGANTIADVLANTEGIYVVGTGQNYGSQTSIFMRGASSNHCVIMIDGVRLSDPSSPANGIDLNEISLTNIERIEVIRGSHSTMYGSSAIGGVVNIITKQGGKPGFHVDAIGSYGMFSGNSDYDAKHENGTLRDLNINLGYTFKFGLYLKAGVISTFSEGFNSSVDTVITPNTYKHDDQGDLFEKLGRNVKLGYKDSAIDVHVAYRNEIQGSMIDDGAFADDDNYSLGFRRKLLTYECKYKFNEHFSAGFNGGATNNYRIAEDDSSLIAPGIYDQTYIRNDYWGTQLTNELQLNGKWKGLEVLGGFTHQQETMTGTTYIYANSMWGVYEDSTDLDSLDLNTSTLNFFAHADISGSLFSEKCSNWSLGLGGRYIDHSQFGSVMTYEITPAYKFSEKGMLYFSYSTGFNAPSMYQLYTPEKSFTGIQRGNKNLRPEYSASIEFGVKRKVNADLNWSASIFRTQVKDVISYVYLWNGATPYDSISGFDYMADTYLNTGTSVASGMELSVNSSFSEKLAVSIGLSVVGGTFTMDESELDTAASKGHHVQVFDNGVFVKGEVEVAGLPRRTSTGSFTITWKPISKLRIAPTFRYVGNRTDLIFDFPSNFDPHTVIYAGLRDYLLIDLNLSYSINKKFMISLKGENLTNQTYQEIRGFASRGIGAYLKVAASF